MKHTEKGLRVKEAISNILGEKKHKNKGGKKTTQEERDYLKKTLRVKLDPITMHLCCIVLCFIAHLMSSLCFLFKAKQQFKLTQTYTECVWGGSALEKLF